MQRMSTRYLTTPRWGWLLLLGGLTACRSGWTFPGLSEAGTNPAPGQGGAARDESNQPGTSTDQAQMGVLETRFQKESFGAAYVVKAADLDGDGKAEVIYGGNQLVAIGSDNQPIWSFDLKKGAAVTAPQTGGREGNEPGRTGEETYGRTRGQEGFGRSHQGYGSEEQGYGSEEQGYEGETSTGAKSSDVDIAKAFMGPHVRDVRVLTGRNSTDLLVLDDTGRVYRLNGQNGDVKWTMQLTGQGNACDLALFDTGRGGEPAFFPSGGRTAYRAEDGKKLFDADIDFDATVVKSGEIDGQRGRDLLLVRGATPKAGSPEEAGFCPTEIAVFDEFMAMKNAKMGTQGEQGTQGTSGEQPGTYQRPARMGRAAQRGGARVGEPNRGLIGREQVGREQVGREQPGREQPGREQPGQEFTGRNRAPSVYAVNGNGDLIWSATPSGGDITTARLADLDGDRVNEVILGQQDGITALGRGGKELWRASVDGVAHDVAAIDVEGNGRAQVFVNAQQDDRSTLYGFAADGRALGRMPLDARADRMEAYDLLGRGPEQLVLSMGIGTSEMGGKTSQKNIPNKPETVVYTPEARGLREIWRLETPLPARAFTAFDADGGRHLLVAGGDAVLRDVVGDTGKVDRTWIGGGMPLKLGAGDIDGDGRAEIASGDMYGNITVTRSDGKEVYAAQLQSDGPAWVTGVSIGDVGAGNNAVVASGFAYHGDKRGVLEAFDNEGNSLFSIQTDQPIAGAQLADLDGDGQNEIVVSTFAFRMGAQGGGATTCAKGQECVQQGPTSGSRGQREQEGTFSKEEQGDVYNRQTARQQGSATNKTCGVQAYDASGKELWQTPIGDCMVSQVSVADVDGDGRAEIAYGDFGGTGAHHVALLDGNGKVRWDATSDTDDVVWIHAMDGGVAVGGRSLQPHGGSEYGGSESGGSQYGGSESGGSQYGGSESGGSQYGGSRQGGTNAQTGGHVSFYAADTGKAQWRYAIEAHTPSPEEQRLQGPFGPMEGSFFGTPVADMTGDRQADIAFTTVNGDAVLLDGATGKEVWTASLTGTEPCAYPSGSQRMGRETCPQGSRQTVHGGAAPKAEIGGPIAYVPGQGREPGTLVATSFNLSDFRSSAYALSDQGEPMGMMPLDGPARDAVSAEWTNGEAGAAIGAGHDVYGLDLRLEGMPRPGTR
jgi:hypothetical protein